MRWFWRCLTAVVFAIVFTALAELWPPGVGILAGALGTHVAYLQQQLNDNNRWIKATNWLRNDGESDAAQQAR